MPMWTSYEVINHLGSGLTNIVEAEYSSLRAEGAVSPMLMIRIRARATALNPPMTQHSVQISRATGRLYIGQDEHPDRLVAYGEADSPLPEVRHNHDQTIELRMPLSVGAIRHIEDAIYGQHYLPALLVLTGSGVHKQGATSFQFQKLQIPMRPSASDWITQVLEPIGWRKYYHLTIPAPRIPDDPAFKRVTTELAEADRQFLSGSDAPVFLHAYNAFDPYFYSERHKLLAAIEPDKRGAVEDLIQAVHRFANGGRHLPEERRSNGGFEVDHIDADYVRALVTHTASYLARRQQATSEVR